LPYLTRCFRWSLCVFLLELAVCGNTRAQANRAVSTAPAASIGTSATPPATSTSPALGGLSVPAGAFAASTPTYSVEPSTPSASEVEQESKRLSRLARILKIRTEGNRNVRERVILAQVKTKKNDLYDPDKLRKDVQAIYGLGNFEDVALEVTDVPGGVIVTFKVIEKPIIKRIDFKGNKKVSSSKLRDAISLKENDPLDKFKLNLDDEKILSVIKMKGLQPPRWNRLPPRIPPIMSRSPFRHGRDPGPGGRCGDTGVTAFKLKKIKKLMKTRRKKVFKQDVLTKDVEEITKFIKIAAIRISRCWNPNRHLMRTKRASRSL